MARTSKSFAEDAVTRLLTAQLERVDRLRRPRRRLVRADERSTASSTPSVTLGVLARFLPALRAGRLSDDDCLLFRAACADAANYFAFAAAKAGEP